LKALRGSTGNELGNRTRTYDDITFEVQASLAFITFDVNGRTIVWLCVEEKKQMKEEILMPACSKMKLLRIGLCIDRI
jgi:hypothetical protein